jgi:hypothetical protein
MKPFDINYRSAEKFFQDYLQLKEGKLFVTADDPLPPKTHLALNISVPRIEYAFQLEGIVVKIRDRETAEKLEKSPGMLVYFKKDLQEFFDNLDKKLLIDEKYQFLLALCETINDADCIMGEDIDEAPPQADETSAVTSKDTDDQNSSAEVGEDSSPKLQSIPEEPAKSNKSEAVAEIPAEQRATEASPEGGVSDSSDTSDEEKSELSFDWLREAIAQEEAVIEEEPPPEIEAPPSQDKKNLNSEERGRVKPAADFIMDLTKAMLRSGYYSPDHPGSQKAKKGLYSNFLKCLGKSPEIMITNLETPKKKDILITGILDEPVSVRTLVGAGMAELFVPKLTEFFNRKGLISFAIKKQITPSHFEAFIDIMSDPKADRGTNNKMGVLLSRALARNNITEISTVFMDDIIVLEKNLPWRVEMAIQRLTKDLKIIPMFKAKSDDAILNLKVKIIHDIIRPLKYGEYLKELLVNCYIIAKHVDNIEAEDIEEIIIGGIPEHLMLPAAHHVFEDLKGLKEMRSKDSAKAALQQRYEGVRRIIKSLSRRMIQQKIKGVQRFLEELHNSKVLAFSELPPDVQYLVNTMKMVRDVRSRTSVYIGWVFKRLNPEDAVVMLKCFRRVIPIIVEEKDWDIGFKLTLAVNKVKSETDLYSPKNNLPSNPFYFVFKDVSDMLSTAYLSEPTTKRLKIDQIVRRLGSKGVDILNLILIKSERSDVRTDAMETIVSMGEVARHWSLKILERKNPEVGEVKNALAILREVGKAKKDTALVKQYISHADPRVQEELLHTLMRFGAQDLEPFIIKALTDSDDKLRWRAASALGKLDRISKDAIVKILQTITSDPPDDDDEQAAIHIRKIAQLIQTLGAVNNFPSLDRLEEAILKAAQKSNDSSGKGFITRLKLSNPKADQSVILLAAFATLGKIGSAKSGEYLAKFSKGKSPIAAEAQKALQLIESRQLKNSAAQAAG